MLGTHKLVYSEDPAHTDERLHIRKCIVCRLGPCSGNSGLLPGTIKTIMFSRLKEMPLGDVSEN